MINQFLNFLESLNVVLEVTENLTNLSSSEVAIGIVLLGSLALTANRTSNINININFNFNLDKDKQTKNKK